MFFRILPDIILLHYPKKLWNIVVSKAVFPSFRAERMIDGRKKTAAFRLEERGVVLVVTLLVTVALLILIMPFLSKISGQYRSVDRSFKSYAALNLAEAGVERAIWELNKGEISQWQGDDNLRTWTHSSVQTSLGSVVGDIHIRIQRPKSANPIITSTGSIQFSDKIRVEKTLQVVLEGEKGDSILSHCLFANNKIKLKEAGIIDSYDSRLGEYDEWLGDRYNRGQEGHIGINNIEKERVVLEDMAKIYGDCHIGVGGDPSKVIKLEHGSEITGEIKVATEVKEIPGRLPPENLPYRGEVVHAKDLGTVLNEDGFYKKLKLDDRGTTYVEGDVTICISDKLELKKETSLVITEGSSLTIYMGGEIQQEDSCQFVNNDPTKLLIIGTPSADKFEWESNYDFHGVIYYPGLDFVVKRASDFYGSVIADEIQLEKESNLHYDKAVKDIPLFHYEPVDANYVVKSWQEKFMP
jgi:hypothetical protein